MAFLYTREAHPGEHHPAVSSLAEKIANARKLATDWKIRRAMLVDDVDGPVHRAYGTLPNMTYIIGRDGKILFRAAWTDPRLIRLALEQFVFECDARSSGLRVRPFYAEWMPGSAGNMLEFMDGLLVAGPRAVDEFIAGMARGYGEPTAAPLRAWWAERRTRT